MIWQEWGSPPHMRGKATRRNPHERLTGITPAYAGKSRVVSSGNTGSGDHPRICGEKPGTSERKPMSSGSPPRMRGKGDAGAGWCYLGRITPAYAGKRHIFGRLFDVLGDHPRICGEKRRLRSGRKTSTGSPPHMRGKAPILLFFAIVGGITPAYAGKRPSSRCHSRRT